MESQFDDLPGLYEEMADWPFRSHMEIPNVFAALGDITGRDVLDFGCGNGMYSRWLKTRGAHRVVGYDVSEGMLNYARRREEKDKLGIQYTSELTPDLGGKFDLVLAVYVLPYATNPQELREMCTQMAYPLKPGGRLVTLPIHPDYERDPSYYEPYGLRMQPIEADVDGGPVQLDLCQSPHDIHVTAYYWSKGSLEDALGHAGFSPVQWMSYGKVKTPPGDLPGDFMDAYWRRPHAALINCQLQ